jgi:hypothetical protein
MNTLSPALVTERGARRLPRATLLLLCAAYVLPGVFGRDPWRNADLVALAQMQAIAEGRVSIWAPTLGQVPVTDAALLPNAIGAAFIAMLGPLLGAPLAARLPFATLLVATLSLVWYAVFHLARTENAQPVPFAFGGEAEPVSYARAMADGSLLALIATLGMLQLGHETTPEMAQLLGCAAYLYALAAAPFRGWQPRVAIVLSLAILAASGAPSVALALGLAGTAICRRSAYDEVRSYAGWVVVATVIATLLATLLGAWRWRALAMTASESVILLRQWIWFLWPTWPFVVWTLWRWRVHALHRHIAVPLALVLVALVTNIAMAGSDRALLLAVPGMAVLAAFALPTFKRSTTAAIDWFTIFFFTVWALAIWVVYASIHTGWPAKPAANVAKLAPGFAAEMSWLSLAVAVAGTLAWIAAVRWRTGRQRDALWKSLVLPAGGVALCWLLLMTLGLPLLDYARSARAWVDRVAIHVPAGACLWTPAASSVTVAALEHFGRWRVDARDAAPADDACRHQVRVARGTRPAALGDGWELIAVVRRPTVRDEFTAVYGRSAPR